MKFRKLLVTAISIALLASSSVSVGALAADVPDTSNAAAQAGSHALPVGDVSDGYFAFFGGIVQKIEKRGGTQDLTNVMVISDSGSEAYLVLSKDTYVSGTLAVGAKATGYYDKNAPMIMIYPPQYSVEAVIVENGGQNSKVDVFDKDLTSSDNGLKLIISDKTQILSQDGTVYSGTLANRKLAVFYGISTKSIPAQTSPDKVVVLYDRVTSLPSTTTQEEMIAMLGDVSAMDIVVENKKITAPGAYINKQGTIMVPIRAIAEALGHEVNWVHETRTVLIGKDISLSIGQSSYYNKATALLLTATPPELTNSLTYVPLSFFRDVVGVTNAYLFEGQIDIDNGEPMR